MSTGATSSPPGSDAGAAWTLIVQSSDLAAGLERAGRDQAFGEEAGGALVAVDAADSRAVLQWHCGGGWTSALAADDPRRDQVDLYLPICSATLARPITIGHLGQSLDGFIATPSGDSQFVTGYENIVHLHALRALCDAVIVGAGTVAADNPQLTTRHVQGAHPLRVVFDPTRRLAPTYRLFTDAAAETVYVCHRSRVGAGETHLGLAAIVGVDADGPGAAEAELVAWLRARGCARVFVEGGGVTVSNFLEAQLLDRLHLAVAPVLIGNGRPAIRLPARPRLRDCERPSCRVFRMGGDVLFDCDLRAPSAEAETGPDQAPVARIW